MRLTDDRSITVERRVKKNAALLAGNYTDRRVVYTDGACRDNGLKTAIAGIGVYFNDPAINNISEPLEAGTRQTNQRAELYAMIRALEHLDDTIGFQNNQVVNICTDSYYGMRCMTRWYFFWITNGWKNIHGNKVRNQDLIRRLRKLIQELQVVVEFSFVPGHSHVHGNKKADALARRSVARQAQRRDEGRY
ncbi:Ribonuclease H1 [Coemansia sp. RSA 485]|nr:Ribonuclease H1 [Coemansia sp. RSA 485]